MDKRLPQAVVVETVATVQGVDEMFPAHLLVANCTNIPFAVWSCAAIRISA